MRLEELAARIEDAEQLEQPAEQLSGMVAEAVGPGPLKDLLSGTWLGHTLHPLLTDVPLGCWMSATILDLLGGEEHDRAARLLIATGLAATVPTVATGAVDWADTVDRDRRVGLVHAGLNSAAATLYGASLLARRRGRRGLGVGLGLLGGAAALAGGYLGGHLTMGRGVGVDHTAFDKAPEEWTPVGALDELPDGEAKVVEVGSIPVLMLRRGSHIDAIANRCTHFGGPLHEGKIEGDTVECPWHASIFCLRDGAVLQGPARAAQPSFEARVNDGTVELRLAR